ILGSCLQAVLISRFCLALRLTFGAGMEAKAALRLSFVATGSKYFESRIPPVVSAIRKGKDVTAALRKTGVLPDELLNFIATGEESGRLPEVMEQQARYYQEEAAIKLRMVTQAAAWILYILIALKIILAMFSIGGPIWEYKKTVDS